MDWKTLPYGIYRCTRETYRGFSFHYGLLDMGNVFRNAQAPFDVPLLYYIGKGRLRIDFRNPEGWSVQLGKRIRDIQGCQLRIQKVQDNPGYDLSGNCGEEFVNYMATARKYSSLDNLAMMIMTNLSLMDGLIKPIEMGR